MYKVLLFKFRHHLCKGSIKLCTQHICIDNKFNICYPCSLSSHNVMYYCSFYGAFFLNTNFDATKTGSKAGFSPFSYSY